MPRDVLLLSCAFASAGATPLLHGERQRRASALQTASEVEGGVSPAGESAVRCDSARENWTGWCGLNERGKVRPLEAPWPDGPVMGSGGAFW